MSHNGDEPSGGRVRLAILGPVEATLDGHEVNLGGRRQRAVIAMLLLARGHQVASDRLLDSLWDGAPPPSGSASLQAYVSHLRRALEPDRAARAPSRVLVGHGSGYTVPTDAVEVDAWQFERLVEEASTQADPAVRRQLLTDALALWRGRALTEYAGLEWADQETRRLDELRDVARERLLAARLENGESALVVPGIEALLVEDPLREERWRLLALALYRSNRQADALTALRAARAKLADELGVDPGPALRALEAEVLAQSPTLDAPVNLPPATSLPDPDPTSSLVDRDAELEMLRGCLSGVLAGKPAVAVIDGPAGIGKTRLMHEVRDEARAAGATVLTARGSLLEKEFGFGVVRQLFEPMLSEASSRGLLLEGAASGAGQVFDATYSPADSPGDGLFTVLHGLYRLTSNLSARGPLVVAVDDVQWCDPSSLRFLGYLVRRLEGLPVLVVATHRTGEQHVDADLLHEITVHPDLVSVQPRPLSPAGTSDVVRNRLHRADDTFVQACFRTTAGNPLLLRQLLRALEAEGVRPDASHADTVRAIGSRAVSSLVLMRFRRMPASHREVARAIAVLGNGATLPLVAAMTRLVEPDTAAAIAGLARSEVLRPDHPLGFVHPLVEAAVYDDLPLGERELQHERAAAVLAASDGSPEQVAAHLLQVPSRGNPEVVRTLRAAADRNVERGATDSAVAHLHRALAEPPTAAERPGLLMELGRLEAMTNGVDALKHLAMAYHLIEDPLERAETAVMLARTAVFAGPRGEATRIATAAAADLPEDLEDHRQALVALARIAGFMHGLPPEEYAAEAPPPIRSDGPGARALAAAVAWEELVRGVDRERTLEMARFAVADRVLQRTDPGLHWVVAANTLFLAGEDTSGFWEQELDEAYRTGSLFAALATHLWLGFVQWQQGDLRAGLQSMRHCTEQNQLWNIHSVAAMYVEPFAVRLHVDTGRPAEARRVLEASRSTPRIGDSVRLFLEAEAHLLLAEGRVEDSLAVLDRAIAEPSVVECPAWRPWRSMRAQRLHALGCTHEALTLAHEELVLAERWGTPGVLGHAWRVLGEIQADRDPDAAVQSLRTAVSFLERSPLRLELALALRSSALEPVGSLPEHAGDLLCRALELAEWCGADGLRDEVASALRRVGVDVPEQAPVQTRLTAIERRVASLAADGLDAHEIAMSMFASRATVAAHLESLHERLGTSSADKLREALARQ